MAIFTKNEIERRMRNLRSSLDNAECGIAVSFHNSYYLSGVPIPPWGRYAITIVPVDDSPAIVVPAFDKERVAEHSPITDIRTYTDQEKPSLDAAIDLTADFVKERKLQKIGIELGSITVLGMELLKKRLPNAQFTDMTDTVDSMRLVSSNEELELIRKASEIADIGMETFAAESRVGKPELSIVDQAISCMNEAIASRYPQMESDVRCSTQQGMRSFQAHGSSVGEKLRSGQILESVIEVSLWHYQASVERGMMIGAPTAKQRQALETMIEAHDKAVEAVRPGVKFSEIDRISRSVFLRAGFTRVDAGTGLIRGITSPWYGRIDKGNIRRYNDSILVPNMVMTVEPCALVSGVGNPRHCDMVLVTKDGHEVLSKARGGMIQL
jgi:Xaa-Pro dipeptidase